MSIFPYKTEPFDFQRKALNLSGSKENFALFMDPGTGKTKVSLDTAAYLYIEREIDGLLVFAPNMVHSDWIKEQIPEHLSEEVDYDCLVWRSSKTGNISFKDQFNTVINTTELAVLTMNYDAMSTEKGKSAVKTFLKKRRSMVVCDESTRIKTPSAQRTRAILNIAKLAAFRRILTGTPSAESPFDLYSQFRFLSHKILGHNTFTSFKNEFGIFDLAYFNGPKARPVKVLQQDDEGRPMYRNLDRLKERMAPYVYRITKEEALPDLPPKLFVKREFDLDKEQRRLYDALRDEILLEFEGLGKLDGSMVLTRILRLQQISCGYLPFEDGLGEHHVQRLKNNTRLDNLKEVIEEFTGPTLIWARFIQDVDQITQFLGPRCVRYDGQVKYDEREESKRRFQDGDVEYLVGNPKSGGIGLTLNRARNVIFYSNYFGLETRIQAEDRAHRIGVKNAVTYIDLIANNTIDDKLIIPSFRNKHEVNVYIMGDKKRDWL